MSYVVQAMNLTKKFGDFTAVDGINFQVNAGECFGFLGPNGAGKTTAIRMVCCASPKTSGELKVAGMDIDNHQSEIKALLGIVPQENNLDPDFTVCENLVVYARYFDIRKAEAEERAAKLLNRFELSDKKNAAIETLSSGMRRRLMIARALINKAKILILDEPTTGLDPQARHLIWDELRKLRREGISIVLTTHYMEEAEELCDRLVIMNCGRIVAEGSPSSLIEKHVGKEVLEVEGNSEVLSYLQRNYSQLDFEATGSLIQVFAPELERLMNELLGKFEIKKAILRRTTLEDVFLKLTGRRLRE